MRCALRVREGALAGDGERRQGLQGAQADGEDHLQYGKSATKLEQNSSKMTETVGLSSSYLKARKAFAHYYSKLQQAWTTIKQNQRELQ